MQCLDRLGAILGHLGAILRHLGDILRHLGENLRSTCVSPSISCILWPPISGKPARREYGKRSQSSVCCGMATHKKQKQMRKQIQKQMHTSNTGIRVRLVKLEMLVMLIILLTLSNTSSISNNRNTDNTRKC